MCPQVLSLADVREFGHKYERFLGRQVEPLPLLLAMSGDVLKHYLGKQWVLDNVFEEAPLDSHFRFGSATSIERYQFSDRVVALAEMLFHFQTIDGIDGRLDSLRASSVETGVGELEGAKLLYTSGISFRFISPTSLRGHDYDVAVTRSGRPELNCEMKCKLPGTELSAATVLSTLQKARKQLPRDAPGLVFLRLPEAWIRQASIVSEMSNALTRFFRSTSRVAAVVFHWEEWYTAGGALRARASKFRVEYNPSSPHADAVRELELEPITPNRPRRQWIYFVSLLAG